ncbi:MAG: radical SAM protein [Deltaproteobacteria bacterium]|nr:radical SAM protein [Deltaproteobacteria bacterium]
MPIADSFANYKRLRGVVRYADILMKNRPVLVNLELIKSCNATCHFCVCWKMDAGPRLYDYGPVIEKIRPIVVSLNGGEPLLRKDICDIVRQVKPHTIYVSLITNAGLLTLEKAGELIDAGLDQLTISLDYLDGRHDGVRGIPNLTRHILTLVPQITATGFKNVVFNTIIMDSNLDQVVTIAEKARELGVRVSFSAYSSNKADNDSEVIADPARQEKLRHVIEQLKFLKRKNKNIVSSEYFFDHVPIFFEHEKIGGCKAGQRWMTITPDGYIQPCSETPRVCHYTEYSPDKFGDIDCDVCWYACRAESQAPVTIKRVAEWIRR